MIIKMTLSRPGDHAQGDRLYNCQQHVYACAHVWPLHCMQVYERLQAMTAAMPVQGNQDGSYLTAFSSGGLQ